MCSLLTFKNINYEPVRQLQFKKSNANFDSGYIASYSQYTFVFVYWSLPKDIKGITANKKYLFLANDNRKIVFDVVSEVLAAPVTVTYGMCYYYDGHYTSQERQGDSKQDNPIAEQYSKYDFSGFDN